MPHARMPPSRLSDRSAGSEFRRFLARMGVLIEAVEQASDAASIMEHLPRLGAMCRRLVAEEEEPDGVYRWLMMVDPDVRPRIARLRAEHREFEATFDQLATRAVSKPAESGETQLVADAHALCARLRAHQAEEMAVLDHVFDS